VQWALGFLAFRLSYAVSGTQLGRQWVIRAYLASAGIFSVIGLYMYLTGDYGRLTGTFYWANPAAAYLIPAVLVVIEKMRVTRSQQQYWWLGGVIGFGTTFWLTDSRAATAVLGILIILYLLLVKLNKRFCILLLFSLIAVFGTSYGLVRAGNSTAHHTNKVVPGSRLNEAIKGESTSGSDRLYYLRSAFDMWYARPLLGVGAGSFGDVHPQFQKRVTSASTSAHNEYVQILAELGIVGAMILAGLLLTLFFGSVRGLIARPELVPVALGLLGLLLHMGLDIDARYPASLGLVGVFFGLIYMQKAVVWVRPTWKWSMVSAAVLLPIIVLYFSDTWAVRAADAQANGDFTLAAEDYGRAQHSSITNPDYINAEGINLYTLATLGGPESTSNAKRALDRALSAEALDPDDGQHFQLEGRILAFESNYPAAEAAYRRALVLDPYNHPDYALDLASVLLKQNKSADALSSAQSMLNLYTKSVIANRSADPGLKPQLANLEALTGNVYLVTGEFSLASAAAERALADDPSSLRGRALKHQLEVRNAAIAQAQADAEAAAQQQAATTSVQ
jgi:O-antigen ligase/tetratricopeptide (TPR) repeat protein